MALKSSLAKCLRPFAQLASRFEAVRRLWAFARLEQLTSRLLDASVVVLGVPEVHGTGDIQLGHGLYLYPQLYLETRERGRIFIGDQVVISRGVHIVAFAGVEIGSGTMIGEYSSIRDANHDYRAADTLRDAGHIAQPIVIGRNVWIGRGVMILPGVNIGDRAVIAANAVVTRDVAAGAVVGGVPAVSLKKLGAGNA